MRPYIVFGSNNNGATLTPLGIYEAPDHDAARKMARTDEFTSYGSTPVGNWSFGKLNVKQVIEIEELDLNFPDKQQMTVADVLEIAEEVPEKPVSRHDLGSGLGKGLDEDDET